MKIAILFIVMSLVGCGKVYAQNLPDLNILTDQQSESSVKTFSSIDDPAKQEMLKRRAAEKVGMMNDYIQFMADKKKSLSSRKIYKDKALNLFIGLGNAYEEDGLTKKGVVMETTSLYRKTPLRRLMRDYFTGLMNLKYTKVDIESTEAAGMKVSNLKKIAETEDGTIYECTCYFDQAFIGYIDGVPQYKDITRKKVTCRIIAEDTVEGEEYTVMLGDVTALDTKRLPN